MTEHLPDEIEYGFVADRVLKAVGDTTLDADRYPDGVAAKGTVRFTPMARHLFTQNDPATISVANIECTINPGHDDPEQTGLLVDPAGHTGNVALVAGWYQVTYLLDGESPDRFPIEVKPEYTAESPGWLPRLRDMVPQPYERFIVNEQVYLDTLAARDETVDYRDQAGAFATTASTAATTAVTARDEAVTARDQTVALGITVDTSVGTRVYVGDTMIHGDTGWRELPLPERFISGRVLIKRENNDVTLRLEGAEITGLENITSNDYLTATNFIPVGFRPPLWGDRPVGFFTGDYAQYRGYFGIAQQSRLLYLVSETDDNLGTGNARASGEMSWTTTTLWPTSLPGNPA